MFYRGRGPWRGYGRRGGLFGIPWILFFLFFSFSHSIGGVIIGLALVILVTIILTRVLSNNSFNGMSGQQPGQTYYQPGQYYQPGNQANQQPYYQPTEQPYQPYDQGYQSPAQNPGYQEGG